MSDHDNIEGSGQDDRAILLALERVMAGGMEASEALEPEQERQVREYVELLGLLPYEVK